MLSNAYFLAKFRFDTAENEPAKNLQNLLIFPILLILLMVSAAARSTLVSGCTPAALRARTKKLCSSQLAHSKPTLVDKRLKRAILLSKILGLFWSFK